MSEISDFGAIILVVASACFLALLGRAITERFAIPSAALFLVAAAAASDLFPGLRDAISFVTVERIGVVALIVILFDGGLDIGWRRFRSAAVPILSLGVPGTFATAGLIALAAQELLGLSWTTSGLLGAALAPTDPAVTFSVLGGREIIGRTGTILKGESGANDPVGIALMIGMIELATSDDGSFWTVVSEFAVEMVGGLAVGAAGAFLLPPLLRRVPLPSPALYPLRMLAAAGVVYRAGPPRGRLRLPRGLRRRDPARRPAAPSSHRGRWVPLLARQPGGDRDVCGARAHDRPDRTARDRRLARGPRAGRPARLRFPPARGRCAAPAGSARTCRALVRDVERPEGRGADPARVAGADRRRRRRHGDLRDRVRGRPLLRARPGDARADGRGATRRPDGTSGRVGVEAAAGLAAEQACIPHRHEARRWRHPRLARLLVQRLGRVAVDVDSDEIEGPARPHWPA